MENNNEKVAAEDIFLVDHFGTKLVDDDRIKAILSREVNDDRLIKIFVSQPMKHRSDEEIIAERNRLFNEFKNKINKLGYEGYRFELLDSFFKDINHSIDVKHEGVWYLGMSLVLLAECDIAIFANGAMSANGCLLERSACNYYKIPFIEEFTMYSDKPEENESFKWTVKKALLNCTSHLNGEGYVSK